MEKTIELISASISDRGLSEKRPQNEDSFAELPQYGVFAVADGVGGAQAGDFASQMAMELLTEAVSNRPDANDAEQLFRLAIDHANRSIHQMATDLPQLSSMATTIVALHLKGNIATVAHVGDSRIYRFTPDGQAYRETHDHSVVEDEVRAGRLSPEEALIHPSRNVISRALGAENTVEIDIKTIMVEPNTTFLLCSDGVTRHVSDEELQSIFATGAQPQLICDHLKELCYSRGAEDNLTAVVVRTFAEPAEEADDFDSTVPVFEEETIATARSAAAGAETAENTTSPNELNFDDTIDVLDLEDENDTAEFQAPEPELPAEEAPPQFVEPLDAATKDEQFLLTDLDDEPTESKTVEIPEYMSSSVIVPAQKQKREPEFVLFGDRNKTAYDATATAGSGLGRILISVGLLILGGAIAVAASYFLGFTGQNEPVEVPQIQTMQTDKIPLTVFEETRRLVDADPVKYLNANAASPQEADDYFWLGRALLLTRKPVEAKRAFEEARRRLPGVNEPSNLKTMENEISMALALVDNPQAFEAFSKIIAIQSVAGNGNANTGGANTGPNR